MQQRSFAPSFAAWKAAAKAALARGEPPQDLLFVDDASPQEALFAGEQPGAGEAGPAWRLPRAFVEAAEVVAAHRDPERWNLLYRCVWRLTHGEPALWELRGDADVLAVQRLRRQVLRDVHACHAYVRFRAVQEAQAPGGRHFIAWYEPDYAILPLAAPHFQHRFSDMHWTLLTPGASVTFAAGALRFGPGATRAQAPAEDELEALWKTYYASIFNPARLNARAQVQQMPRRFWPNAPEAALNRELVRSAPARAEAFMKAQPPRAPVQSTYASLPAIRRDLKQCAACAWAQHATQAVGGEGPASARLAMVGEQPGDQEDRADRPFVGPAGQLFDRALVAAGLTRTDIYLTNAVKHFKFEPRGKRRLHAKPNATDVAACRGWLVAELAHVQPQVLVCLGLTAALSVFSKQVRLRDVRGVWHQTSACAQTLVTTHPSAILRMPPQEQEEGFASLVADLVRAKEALKGQVLPRRP